MHVIKVSVNRGHGFEEWGEVSVRACGEANEGEMLKLPYNIQNKVFK